MNKYIIKNCPVYKPEHYRHCCDLDGNYKCQNCTDCLLKQIVEMCVDKMDNEFNSSSVFAQEILDILDISEVE